MTLIRKYGGQLACLIGFAILVWLWTQFSARLMGEALLQAGWKLIPLALLGLLWMPFDVLALAELFPKGQRLPWMRLSLLEWSSESLGNLVPSAGLAGEPFRYRHIGDLTPQPAKTILVYRLIHAQTGLVSTAASALVCAVFGFAPNWPWWELTWVSGILSLIGLLALLRWRPFGVTVLLKSVGWKCLTRFLQAAEFAALFVLLGVEPTFERVFMIQGFVAASASLFAFIPGGIGVQEGVIVEGCVLLGLGGAFGFQMGFLRRCRQLLWAGLGVLAAMVLEAASRRGPKSPGQSDRVDEPGAHPGSE